MIYKLSFNVNVKKVADGASIVLNSNDGQYYHFDKSTTEFIDALLAGTKVEDFCKKISERYSIELSQILIDYKLVEDELVKLKVLEVIK